MKLILLAFLFIYLQVNAQTKYPKQGIATYLVKFKITTSDLGITGDNSLFPKETELTTGTSANKKTKIFFNDSLLLTVFDVDDSFNEKELITSQLNYSIVHTKNYTELTKFSKKGKKFYLKTTIKDSIINVSSTPSKRNGYTVYELTCKDAYGDVYTCWGTKELPPTAGYYVVKGFNGAVIEMESKIVSFKLAGTKEATNSFIPALYNNAKPILDETKWEHPYGVIIDKEDKKFPAFTAKSIFNKPIILNNKKKYSLFFFTDDFDEQFALQPSPHTFTYQESIKKLSSIAKKYQKVADVFFATGDEYALVHEYYPELTKEKNFTTIAGTRNWAEYSLNIKSKPTIFVIENATRKILYRKMPIMNWAEFELVESSLEAIIKMLH